MNDREIEPSARSRSFRLFIPPGYFRRRLATAGLGLWLGILVVAGTTVLLFLGGALVPALGVEVIVHWLMPAIVVVFLGVLGTALLMGRIRWLFSGQAAGLYLWATAMVLSLIVLFYSVELWRGKRAWAKVTQEAAARGEKIDPAAVAPPDVPDDQNFAKAAVFAPLFDLVTNAMGELVPRETPAYKRLQVTGLPQMGFRGPDQFRYSHLDSQGSWLGQRFIDLDGWYDAYRSRTNLTKSRPAMRRLDGVTPPPDGAPEPTPPPPLPGDPATAVIERQVRRYGPAFPGSWTRSPQKSLPAPAPGESATVLLEAMREFDDVLNEVAGASQRPFARFPVRYEGAMLVSPPAHSQVLCAMCRALRLRAVAELALQRSDEAMRDVRLGLRLIDYGRQQPWLSIYSGRNRVLLQTLQPVWEGLANRRWSEAQLVTLQGQLCRMNLLEDYPASIRADMLSLIEFVNQIVPTTPLSAENPRLASEQSDRRTLAIVRFFYPRGWSYQDQAALYRFYQEVALPALDLTEQQLTPERQRDFRLWSASSDPFLPVIIEPRARQMVEDAVEQFPFVQTALNEATLACALERYRLTNGQFPETLDALVPGFIEKMPHDIINGQPLRYRRTEGGLFTLYSVGRNGVDDDGVPSAALLSKPQDDVLLALGDGDWVWRYPAKAGSSADATPQSER